VQGLVVDQCSEGLDDAHLTLGSSPCNTTYLHIKGFHIWTCDWPGVNHPLSRCIDSVNSFSSQLSVTLSSLSLLAKGGLTVAVVRRLVAQALVAVVRRLVAQALVAASISTGGLATPVVLGLLGTIAVLETVNELITVANAGDPHRLAKLICDAAAPFLSGFPLDLRLTADKAPGQVRTIAADLHEPPTALEPDLYLFQVADSFCMNCEYARCALSMEMMPLCGAPGCACFTHPFTSWTLTGKYCHSRSRIRDQACSSNDDCPGDEFCLAMHVTPDLEHTRNVCGGYACNPCPGSRYDAQS
jgi:hypothetical protein